MSKMTDWFTRNREKLVIVTSGSLIVTAWLLRPLGAAFIFWAM